MNPLLDAALGYAAHGWAVLPLRPRGKEPLTPHGVKDATAAQGQIVEWWRRWPEANVGIACGHGLLVVDLDPRAGSDYAWPELVGDRVLPPAPEVATGGGGRHFYFAGEGRGGTLAPGVELKGAGSYVVGPPSVHPSGRRYVWVTPPDEVELPPLPLWLAPRRSTPQVASGCGIPEGARNAALTSIAGALRRRGLGEKAILAALKEINTAECAPPLPDEEVVRIAHSVARYEPSASPVVELLSAGKLLALPAHPHRWLVDNLLLAGGTSLLVAKPKVGKSTLARSLAVSVARGEPFLERETVQGLVLYLAFEGRLEDHRDHLLQLGLRPGDPFYLAPGGDRAALEGWVEELQPALVIVDTLGHLQRARDGNAYLEVINDLAFLIRLGRETGAHLLLLHHASKGADARSTIDAALGSTAYAASVDTVMRLKRRDDGVRTFEVEHRVGDPVPEVALMFDGVRPTLGPPVSQLELDRAMARIMELQPEAATLDELQEALGVRREVVLRAVKRLVEEGHLVAEGTGRRGDVRRYRVTKMSFPESPGNRGNRICKLPENAVGNGANSVPECSGTESRLNFDISDWITLEGER